jgi:hypothetical protein
MIILDTNVLSELMREKALPRVLQWLSAQPSSSLFTTAISEAEVLYGVAALPKGKRHKALEEAAMGLFQDFGGRILSFDSAAARHYAEIAIARRLAGQPISFADAQIVAIARSRGAKVATRDGAGFAGCGVELVDPWSDG